MNAKLDSLFKALYDSAGTPKFLSALGALLVAMDPAPAAKPTASFPAQTGAAFLANAREGRNLWGEPWVSPELLAGRLASLPGTLAAWPGRDAGLVEALHLLGLDGDIEYTDITLDEYVRISITQPGHASGG